MIICSNTLTPLTSVHPVLEQGWIRAKLQLYKLFEPLRGAHPSIVATNALQQGHYGGVSLYYQLLKLHLPLLYHSKIWYANKYCII